MCSFSSHYVCPRANLRSHIVTSICTHTNAMVVIDVLVVVYDKTWEIQVMLFLHGQLVQDIRPQC